MTSKPFPLYASIFDNQTVDNQILLRCLELIAFVKAFLKLLSKQYDR